MAIEYYDLPGLEEIAASDLVLPRSQLLCNAIRQHREYSLIQALRSGNGAQPKREYLIVDVTCDQVPSRNAHGILYRERLALEVTEDKKLLINVLALRKDFPILLHQNQSRMGTPAQLCLYFESPRDVLRTWTPQNFLRRIIWWLEKSARGELHPADQPVEGLFFVSPFELVLPWDFSEQQQAGTVYTFLKSRERPDKSTTFFAWPSGREGVAATDKQITVIEFELPAMVHGQVEQDPFTLGDLVDLFQSKHIDLVGLLGNRLKLEGGIVANLSADQDMLLLLVHIPMKRSQESMAEGISRRAFVVRMGPLKLGITIGFLAVHGNQVINDVLGKVDTGEQAPWRSIHITPMTLLYFNSAEKSRLKSGIVDAGPKGLIVGAGALGSAMLDLWVRSGWGSWIVVDNDHLMPHNIVRHVGVASDVGVSKANIAAQHCYDISLGAVEVAGLPIDGCEFSNEDLLKAHRTSSLVIDASTTLDYPRAASQRDDFSRHITTFITPNGNSAVLLAEDQNRTIRLQTLEAQYYRALINGELGDHDICTSQGSFISGSSCRDISTVMPYSKVMSHASTLAEQIISLSGSGIPAINVWNRNESNGSVVFCRIAPKPERQLEIDGFRIYFDQGLEDKVRFLREQAFPNETGGILLGYYDFNIRGIVAVDVMPPPQDSLASPVSFERGLAGTREALQVIASKTAGMVGYIGEWHSHPPGHSAQPSRDDYFQIIYLALGMAADGLPAISLIVGENDLQVLKCEAK